MNNKLLYGDENLDLKTLESGATQYIDYIPTDHPYLAGRSPFYFADMDYDGQEELVVVNIMQNNAYD